MKYSFSRKLLMAAALLLAPAALAQQTNLASAGDVRGVLNVNNGGTGVNTAGLTGCPVLTNGVWSFSSANCSSSANIPATAFLLKGTGATGSATAATAGDVNSMLTGLANCSSGRNVLNPGSGTCIQLTVDDLLPGVHGSPCVYNGSQGTNCPPGVSPAGSSGAIQYNGGSLFGGSAASIDAQGDITAPASTTASLGTVLAVNHSQVYSAQVAGSLAAAVALLPASGGNIEAEHDSGVTNAGVLNGFLVGNKLPSHSSLVNRTGGSFGLDVVSPAFSQSRNLFTAMPLTFLDYVNTPPTQFAINSYTGMSGVDLHSEITVPGFAANDNWGTQGGGSFTDSTVLIQVNSHSSALSSALTVVHDKTGNDDQSVLNMYANTKLGGYIGDDEYDVLARAFFYEDNPYQGTMKTAAAAGATVLSVNCSAGGGDPRCNELGVRQVLLDETSNVLSGTQTVTGSATDGHSPNNANSNTYSILTTSYAMPVSSSVGSVSVNCPLPGTPGVPQATTCTLAMSTAPVVNHTMTVGGAHPETTVISAVTPTGTSGVYTVTANMTWSHEAGSTACTDGVSGRYVEQSQYTYTRNGFTRRYVMKALCSPAANTLWLTWQSNGYSTNAFITSGQSIMYSGADTLDVREPNGAVYDPYTYGQTQQLTVSPIATAFAAGDSIEQVNNISGQVDGWKGGSTTYNPYMNGGYGFGYTCTGTACGGLTPNYENGGGLVQLVYNEPASSYTFNCALQGNPSGCVNGFWTPYPAYTIYGYNGGGLISFNAPESAQTFFGAAGGEPIFTGVGQCNSVGHFDWMAFPGGDNVNYNCAAHSLTYTTAQVFSQGITVQGSTHLRPYQLYVGYNSSTDFVEFGAINGTIAGMAHNNGTTYDQLFSLAGQDLRSENGRLVFDSTSAAAGNPVNVGSVGVGSSGQFFFFDASNSIPTTYLEAGTIQADTGFRLAGTTIVDGSRNASFANLQSSGTVTFSGLLSASCLGTNGSGVLQAGSCLANPMTGVGDMIYGGTGGVATRLAAPASTGAVYALIESASEGAAAAPPYWSPLGQMAFQNLFPYQPSGGTYNGNATLVASSFSEHYECGGAYTLTLPSSPLAYMTINVVNISSSASCTVASGSANIGDATLASSVTIAAGSSLQFTYYNTSGNWRLE